MDKMTPDAIALNRSTEGLAAGPIQPSVRARAGMDADIGPAVPSGAQQRRAILTRTVQLEVIPQLLRRPARCGAGIAIEVHVKRLATLSLHANSKDVVDFCTGLMENGLDAERIYLDLLTPTAVLLGEYWTEDLCTFADVTIGIGHLQTAMRVLRPAFLTTAAPTVRGSPRAVLIPPPGEQHTFGLAMLSAFFARAGWDAWSGAIDDAAEMKGMVRRDWIHVIGLSLSHDALLEITREHIASIRATSRNPNIIVLVGGLPFAQDTALAASIGADATALNGAHAVQVAKTLLDRQALTR